MTQRDIGSGGPRGRFRNGTLTRVVIGTLGVASVAVMAGGVARATIPSAGSGVIHGCYVPSFSVVRVIDTDAGQTCAKTEKALDWNQTGPPGPTGATGPAGTGASRSSGQSVGADTYYASEQDSGEPGIVLRNEKRTPIVSLTLPGGPNATYAIFAKVSVSNFDNDPQDAECSLSGTLHNDRSRVRLGDGGGGIGPGGLFPPVGGPGASEMQVTVQDTAALFVSTTVTLSCSTFDGYAVDGVITAIKVGGVLR